MRRKIAFFFASAMTVVLAVMRAISATTPESTLSDTLWILACVSIIGIFALVFSRKSDTHTVAGIHASLCGWTASFCGAVISISVLLDLFCWVVYKQVPPPNSIILNNVDMGSLILSMIFGLFGGAFLVVQGFRWMACQTGSTPLLRWLSLSPVFWLWFRLARYEISYASTIDIQESFFDFAVLIFGSLFFLQFARILSGVGPKPKNGLLICSLCAAMIALSGLPVAFIQLAGGANISTVLITIVDAVVGLLAYCYALSQVFPVVPKHPLAKPSSANSAQEAFAWTDPAKTAVFEPPFVIDRAIPTNATVKTVDHTEDVTADGNTDVNTDAAQVPVAAPNTHSDTTATTDLSIDDLISEIESEQGTL